MFLGGVYAAAGVITNLAKKKLLPHVRYATKISSFYVARKIILAASWILSSCKTTRMLQRESTKCKARVIQYKVLKCSLMIIEGGDEGR